MLEDLKIKFHAGWRELQCMIGPLSTCTSISSRVSFTTRSLAREREREREREKTWEAATWNPKHTLQEYRNVVMVVK
jgi:hypothetical protein